MFSQQTLMELSLCLKLASSGREVTDTVAFRFWPHSRKVEMPASLTPPSCAQPGSARAGSECPCFLAGLLLGPLGSESPLLGVWLGPLAGATPRDPGFQSGVMCAAAEPGLGFAVVPPLRAMEVRAEHRWAVVCTQY